MALSVVVIVGAGVSCDRSLAGPPSGSTRISIDLANGETLDAIEHGRGPQRRDPVARSDRYEGGLLPLMPLVAEATDGGRSPTTHRVWATRRAPQGAIARATSRRWSSTLAATAPNASRSSVHRMGAVVSLESVSRCRSRRRRGAVGRTSLRKARFEPGMRDDLPVMLAVAEDNEPYASDGGSARCAAGVEPVIVIGRQPWSRRCSSTTRSSWTRWWRS